jgi:hypothetical protein
MCTAFPSLKQLQLRCWVKMLMALVYAVLESKGFVLDPSARLLAVSLTSSAASLAARGVRGQCHMLDCKVSRAREEGIITCFFCAATTGKV